MIEKPWEQAGAAALRSYSDQHIDRLTATAATQTLDTVEHAWQSLDRSTALFGTRLVLTAVDLVTEACPRQAAALRTKLIQHASESQGAFAAREVMRHEAARSQRATGEVHALNTIIRKAGLGLGTIPHPLLADLTAAVEIAETVLTGALGVPIPHRSPGHSSGEQMQ
ncbi:hypothetical protein [Streptomyces triculaminicus]|uniref:hypothetical protein n=1 Tax=Streptomyces triculaminicus TaxID=2816232 RepID=UPI0037D4F955